MSDFSRFRSAFNGFSRTDVVNYIEETSATHQKAIEQLEGEKQQLMQEKDHLLAENARLTTELADLKAAQEKLKEEDSALSQQIVTLSQEASELAERAQRAQKELEDLKAADAGACRLSPGRAGRAQRHGAGAEAARAAESAVRAVEGPLSGRGRGNFRAELRSFRGAYASFRDAGGYSGDLRRCRKCIRRAEAPGRGISVFDMEQIVQAHALREPVLCIR